jgi:GntR family transcriptional regulator
MFKLPLDIKAGVPIYEQIIMATKKAIAIGILKPGDAFPSVREISKQHNVNPNTVQKALTNLINEEVLEVHPGRGTVIKNIPKSDSQSIEKLINQRLSEIIVELRLVGAEKKDLLTLIDKLWKLEV